MSSSSADSARSLSAPPTRSGLRVALGLFTRIPVGNFSNFAPATAARAIMLAPVAVVPTALASSFIFYLLAAHSPLPGAMIGLLLVATLSWSSRGLHVDGLADSFDGLAASLKTADPSKIMKSGDIGPAGVLALLVVLGSQAALISSYAYADNNPIFTAGLLAAAIFLSRSTLPLACSTLMPVAKHSTLGAAFGQTVRLYKVVLSFFTGMVGATGILVATQYLVWVVAASRGHTTPQIDGEVLALFALVALLTTLFLWGISWYWLNILSERFAGINGDVLGGMIEICFLTALTALYIFTGIA